MPEVDRRRRRPRRPAPRSPGPFASGMPAGPSGCPAARGPRRRSRGRRRSGGDGRRAARRPTPAASADDRRRQRGARARGASRRAARSLPCRRIEPPTGHGCVDEAIAAGSGPVASRPRGPATAPAASSGVVSSTGTTASAPGGHGRAGRDPDRRPAARPRRPALRRPRTSPMTSSVAGASSVAVADIGGPDRVAVHRRVVPRRQRDAGDDRLGGDPPERLGEPRRLGLDRARDRREDRVARLLDAQQAVRAARSRALRASRSAGARIRPADARHGAPGDHRDDGRPAR